MKRFLTMACVAAMAVSAQAQKAYQVNFTATPPVIDGVAAATEWQAAPQGGGDFVAHDTGVLSTEQTVFRVLWDSTTLYLLMQAVDNNVAFDPSLTGNSAAITFTNDDLELFLDPIASRNSEPNPCHKYQMVFYPKTDASGEPVDGPTGFIWGAAGATDFPGVGTWPSASGATVRAWVTVIPIGPSQAIVTMEAQIPFAAFDVATVNTAPVNLPPQNGDVWSAQPARAHNAGSANNTAASKWNPSAAGFRTKPWGLWTFAGAPNLTAAQDWQHLE